MLPWRVIGKARAASGGELVLSERGGEYSLRIDGWELMSSRKHGSEDAMAAVGCAPLAGKPGASVLVAGLGMGFTLRAALDRLAPGARVTVAEMVPAVVDWNRDVLGPLAGRPLDDPRVAVVVADVAEVLQANRGAYDAILLDTDNDVSAFAARDPKALYSTKNLRAARAALRPGGVLVIWSAGPVFGFTKRMREAGFAAEEQIAPAQADGRGARHVLFVGRPGANPRPSSRGARPARRPRR